LDIAAQFGSRGSWYSPLTEMLHFQPKREPGLHPQLLQMTTLLHTGCVLGLRGRRLGNGTAADTLRIAAVAQECFRKFNAFVQEHIPSQQFKMDLNAHQCVTHLVVRLSGARILLSASSITRSRRMRAGRGGAPRVRLQRARAVD